MYKQSNLTNIKKTEQKTSSFFLKTQQASQKKGETSIVFRKWYRCSIYYEQIIDSKYDSVLMQEILSTLRTNLY